MICSERGEPCLEEWALSQMAEEEILEVTYDINGVLSSFIITPTTGEVLDGSTYAVVCITGGQECLDQHVETLRFTSSIIGNESFRVYKNGTVFTDDGLTLICATGGQDCLLQ